MATKLHQSSPVQAILEGLVIGLEEDGRLTEVAQDLIGPAHDMHVREIVQLHGGTHSEVVTACLRTELVQVAANLGFSRGRKGEK